MTTWVVSVVGAKRQTDGQQVIGTNVCLWTNSTSRKKSIDQAISQFKTDNPDYVVVSIIGVPLTIVDGVIVKDALNEPVTIKEFNHEAS